MNKISFENRIKRLKLTCDLKDDDKVRHFHNGYEYLEIGGVKWATMNVGATRVTDYGLYFQWGDTQGCTADQVGSREGKKIFYWNDYKWTEDGGSTFTKYNSTVRKTVLEASDDAVTAVWGGNWRMPTKEDFDALRNNTTNEWKTNYQGSGINGILFTDRTDSSKKLFFPACGYCENGFVYGVGNYGFYWSSSLYSNNVRGARHFGFSKSGAKIYGSYRYCGFGIRGVLAE